ncbi:MAG: hypothetical protein O3A51_12745, partial [Verrucomicrobia bacterium]|nr:hypothetical protein [Verrucomicrobiota bacterium]
YGLDPYCNITDDRGCPLPVFGPIEVMKPRLATPFMPTIAVSKLLPSQGKLKACRYPTKPADLDFAPLQNDEKFFNVYPIFRKAGQDALLYFRCRFSCVEPMRLALLLGYDGPVKAWVDKRELFHDPAGTNPAIPDGCSIPFRAAAGNHEVMIALGSNHAQAWGIYLRFERLGLKPVDLQSSLKKAALPVVID